MPLDNENLADLPNGYRINGTVNYSQSTKPTNNTIGDCWYKPSDGTEWFWNGSNWLSKETLVLGSDYREQSISTAINLWGTAFSGRDLASGRSGIYYLNAANACYQTGATDAANYWSITFFAIYSDGTLETLASHTTASKPADQWFELRTAINSPKSSLGKTTILVYANIAKIGLPASIYVMSSVHIKWIHP
jgi:hypothetical protein